MAKKQIEKDPLWFKQAVIYQLHIKSFLDSNGDGIGDFNGLSQKLDYLESLGITAVWLLPFYPSPLKDDGYDISNYFDVNPMYGTLHDFKRFLYEAHKRGIRVIIELVINHTSDQHPWFQRARRASPKSVWRNFYVWSETPERFKEARVIFQDFETSNWTWDPLVKAYYWHRFYSHQPDLNFANPMVQKEIFRALDFWFEMGVDGLRLDAVPYLFEEDGTNCENLPTTHDFVRRLRQHMDNKFENRILIAEANQWPEDAVAYFGTGNECHMAFHFPVMPRLFMAIQMEDRFPIIDILEQTPSPPTNCQWAMFLRNHDELTLEMVSDEERDYMYRIYAKDPKARINLGIRRRLAPLLDNDRSRIELMNILLFSLPGTPVIYYGDEIGMGDNYFLGDRNGVRTPMQWNAELNAGFSKTNPHRLHLPVVIDPSYRYEVINVDDQEQHAASLLWWVRHIIFIRKAHKAFGFGSLEFISSENSKTLAFTRTYQDEIILVTVNLSRFPQGTDLDLAQYVGYTPHEMFNYSPFPPIKEGKYTITLSPYGYFWLILKPIESYAKPNKDILIPAIILEKSWYNIMQEPFRERLEKIALPRFFKNARWFGRKASSIREAKITSHVIVDQSYLCFVEISYDGYEGIDTYLIVFSFASQTEADKILRDAPQSIIAHLKMEAEEGVLYDGVLSEDFQQALIRLIAKNKPIKFGDQKLLAYKASNVNKNAFRDPATYHPSQVLLADQSNTSIIYGQQFFLKLYRKLEEGVNADGEIQQFLTEKAHFSHIPQFLGAIEWKSPQRQSTSIAILETFIPNQGTGWSFTLDALTQYYEKVLLSEKSPTLSDGKTIQLKVEELIEDHFMEAIRILGQRTAEMHLALSSQPREPLFSPEPFSILYQRSLYQGMRSSLIKAFQSLRENLDILPDRTKPLAEGILKKESEILSIYHKTLQKKIDTIRIRIHGDYHLGQVLYTGKDFYIIDFEGEPMQTMSARRIKRCPLQDVAGMLRSFYYAAYQPLYFNPLIKAEFEKLEPWASLWYEKICHLFIESYSQTLSSSHLPIVPKNEEVLNSSLQIFLLQKAIYELIYELNMRPEWILIPCKGILHHLKEENSS